MQIHQNSGHWRLGLALSLLTAFLWGILPIALVVVLQVLDVYTITWFRFGFAFALLAVYLAVRQQLPKHKLRLNFVGLLAIAVIFLGLNYLFFLQGLAQTSPANAQVLIQLAPVIFGLAALVIFKERYTLRQWVGMATLISGFVLFCHEQLRTLITAQSEYLLGSGSIVLAATLWAVYALAQKQLLQVLPSSSIMLVIYGGCALMFYPLAAPQTVLTLDPLHLGMLLFCALNTAIAYGAFAEALNHWEASRVSAVVASTPIFTLISVWLASSLIPDLIAPARLTILGFVGAVLVVFGSAAIALGKTRYV